MSKFIKLIDDLDRPFVVNCDHIVMIEVAVRDEAIKLSFLHTANGPGQRSVKETPEEIFQKILDAVEVS